MWLISEIRVNDFKDLRAVPHLDSFVNLRANVGQV